MRAYQLYQSNENRSRIKCPRTALSLINAKLPERGRPIASFQLLPIKLDLQCYFSADDDVAFASVFFLSSVSERDTK